MSMTGIANPLSRVTCLLVIFCYQQLYCSRGSKIFHVLKAFGCVCIDKRTFFRHQNTFLHPSIVSVWKRQEANLLQGLRSEKRGLIIIGGDGRADSPGHSAKFGSYTVMELKKKVVLDIQLVQVGCVSVCN